MSGFELSYSADAITLKTTSVRGRLLSRLLAGAKRDLSRLSLHDSDLLCAIADLKSLAEDAPGELTISSDEIRVSHRLAAKLDSETALVLGLPALVDLTFRTDVEGLLGSANFKIRYEWSKNGQHQNPRRVGSILETADGPRRLPEWLLNAIDIAENMTPGADDAEHWERLAKFRQALDPEDPSGSKTTTRISMTDFLAGLQVRLADRFSLSPNEEGSDFEIVPFSGRRLADPGVLDADGLVTENHGELTGSDLRTFQDRVRHRGALAAYRVNPRNYVVVDRAAMPVLQVLTSMQQAPRSIREDFIRNPWPRISEAVEESLRQRGSLDGLDQVGVEEAVELAAGPLFVETREFSQRVIGLKIFQKQDLPASETSTTWLPEDFGRRFAEFLSEQALPELAALRERVAEAVHAGRTYIDVDGLEIPARQETLRTIDTKIAAGGDQEEGPEPHEELLGPVVLETADNISELRWIANLKPRKGAVPSRIPEAIRTALKEHQTKSLAWQVDAWTAGLPGILNADEQGLGKTLQTISFLAWLQAHMREADPAHRGPILVVAPTSLLVNWEEEVVRHLHEPGLGHLIRLYGSATGARKVSGTQGRDIDGGESKLDFDFLHEAVQEGRAHRFWLLTTYTTLTNYQHSLAKVPFAAAVFDEIQAIKNPFSMRAEAARTIKADFRIGLTGTPIENSAADLWAIMDQLAPGSLGTLDEFRSSYGTATTENMADLHRRVFKPHETVPPLAIRRLKSVVASDLPEKSRRIHPRSMPKLQSEAYEDAKLKLAQGGRGAALKMLHHIRAVSVHPAIEEAFDHSKFISASARLDAAFHVLRSIERAKERTLVFIEHRQMQYRFIELAKAEFGLRQIDLINGDTPIQKRQEIVNRFQLYGAEPGFDLLVLGPKAAGTGLTLTAATHVIHLSRWWNPAVEEQCNDRVHRIGQTRAVTVHIPMSVHPEFREQSFDCLLHSLMQKKRNLADSALWPMGDTDGDAAELQRMVANGTATSTAGADPVETAMSAMFARDGIAMPPWESDRSLRV